MTLQQCELYVSTYMTKRPLPHFVKPRDFDGESSSSKSKQKLVFEERTGSSEAHDPSVEGSSQPIVFNNPYTSLSIQQQRSRLPIFKNRNQILYLLEKYQTVVIVGETGCGKSTQLPQYLVETGWAYDNKKVCVTQPRRVSAITLAQRVAEERMSLLGNDVGYVVRFDECCSEKAPIKFVTDGILVREIMKDPLLSDYRDEAVPVSLEYQCRFLHKVKHVIFSVIMVDEAHERTIYTDIIIGLLRKIIARRPDLRIIISSATIDAELFRDFFNRNETKDPEKDTSTIISVEGRTYPVKIFYKKNPVADYLRETVNTVLKIHKLEAEGDILSFLTGQDEVESVCQMLRNESNQLKNYDRLWVLPMYGGLSFREQMKVFESSPAGTRKVIVATNIAEASVTIPGISYGKNALYLLRISRKSLLFDFVIDCGFMKLRALKPETGIESLIVVPISQASAEQRAGRAGRLKPGRAYRLYPEEEYVKLMPASIPELQKRKKEMENVYIFTIQLV
uniref:ATP-dependent RNA helicase DHX35 n=1 Tax=Romanomermis culicivorax TaxID=13658 RepID=A0A915KID7_ROMCU